MLCAVEAECHGGKDYVAGRDQDARGELKLFTGSCLYIGLGGGGGGKRDQRWPLLLSGVSTCR